MNGFVKVHRKLLEWEWWGDHNTTRLWVYILVRSNFKPTRWRGIELKPGEFVTSLPSLSKETGLSIQSVRTAIKHLKSTGEITDRTTRHERVISVCNWEAYQIEQKDLNSHINSLNNSQVTDEQQDDNRELTPDEEGEEREEGKKVIRESLVSGRRPKDLAECIDYAAMIGVTESDACGFYDSQESGGWSRGGVPLKDWRAALRTWKRFGWLASDKRPGKFGTAGVTGSEDDIAAKYGA